jgi:polar amino acid transport system substrate-binding protein
MHRLLRGALAVLAAAMVIAVGGCSGTRNITIGIASNASPLSSQNTDGEPEGFIVEMAREAVKRMGVGINFKFVNMNDKSKNFSAQGVDALWGRIEPNEQNKKTMLFTKRYLTDSQVLIVKSSSTLEDKSDLSGKVIGAVTGSAARSALLKSNLSAGARGGAPVEYKELVSAFMELNSSKADALAVDETYARYIMAEHAEQYRLLTGSLAKEEYAVAVRRNDSNLRDDFEAALDAMKADGTSASISKKWFGIDMT